MSGKDRRSQKRVIVYRSSVPGENEVREVRYDAVADALHFACRDLREGRREPIEIVEDGVRIYDSEAIAEECESREVRLPDPAEVGADEETEP